MVNDATPEDGASGPDDNGLTRISTDWREYGYPSTAVVETVADVTGQDVTDLPPLHGHVDSDALDALLTTDAGGSDDSIRVTFEYAGYRVELRSDRTLLLHPLARQHGDDP